ncbi:trypsin-like peptidase domain-containing protein [Tumebacillus sp. ITR2]|uniref:Trypsin-like peptidase domain-containing protein n=1 Tax=Tumebacillus amylolyticus TaxID=2801339 RepID=A0ABS1J7Y7_9BACL|nr:trypsin-like peptidase domain-containing protein [Tumebacillus amylolyticus]MBL0386379.1 trypsin-like peptidase domain-containing protein [Tumebacillus amylolyticus]
MEHFPEIEKRVVRVICKDRGTAFLINDRWLLTAEHVVARHNVDPNEGIKIEIPYLFDAELSMKAEIVDVDESLDIALLQLLEPLEGVHGLKLVSAPIRNKTLWETFGYPTAKLTAGERVRGHVRRSQIRNEALIWDMDLSLDDEIKDADALSGAPVIIDGVVQGVVLRQLEGTLGAISIEKIRGFLEKNGILYEIAPDSDELPEGLNEVAKQAILNHPVIEELEQHIIQTRKGFLMIKGSPGSGKTTLTATYTPDSKEIDICGKYFVRNDLDDIPVSYRASEITFAEWLDAIIHRVLYNDVPEKKERLLRDWISHLSDGLRKLSAHYVDKNQIGVFFIDGVDDVHHLGKTTDFFSLIPENLPDNVVVIISVQTEEVLPAHLQARLSSERVIKVVPLAVEQCRHYISTRTSGLQLPLALIDSISEKAEGHPLYLRYLVEFVKQLSDVQEIENWIREVPAFGGEIGNYYESIWQTVRRNQHETWMLGTVARLRSGIDRASLERMLPDEARYVFLSVFPKIQHLLVNDDTVSIYHSSFAMFIDEKTNEIEERVHKAITQFCIDNREHPYAVKNILFHMLNAGEEMRKESVRHCNQGWADRCARWHVEPDLILADLEQVLDAAIILGDISAVISLLLLSQRISFRYNNIFAEYAAELATTLIAMGRSKEAIRYIIRESVLIVSGSDALYFLHRLYEAGAAEEAEKLFKAIRMRFVNQMDHGSVTFGTMKTYYGALSIETAVNSKNPTDDFSQKLYFLYKIFEQGESTDDDSRLIEDIVAYNRAYLLWKKGIYIPISSYVEQGVPFGKGIATLLCKILLHLDDLEAWGNFSEVPQYQELLQDIEYVMGRYGIDEDDTQLILVALTDVSLNPDIIKKLIDEVKGITDTKFSLRKSNGVDLDNQSVMNYLDAWRYKGFLEEEDNYPSIMNFGTSEWEYYFEEILSFVGYMLGKAWKAVSMKQSDRLASVSAALEQYLLPKLIAPLKERVDWDRSYALPESFYPYVFKEVASFYVKYCVDQLPVFVQIVESHSSDQLGLYTEGFRGAMFSIITEMMKTKKHVKSTFGLLKVLEEHITRGVQNRWERSRDLLQTAELYARLGSEQRSQTTFQQMLDTSMGPSWYKEDQLTLLETSISYLQRSGELSVHLKEIAGHYDFASGEMTFQRYVRQVKEAFIGSLCSMGRVTHAVEYFKNTVLPTPEKVLQFAESVQIDSPEPGEGYVFGAGGLEEQSCILEILENAPNVKGLLKWAFCELFLIGDDRYFDRYTRIMADLLNERETSGSDELPVLYRRLLRIMISDMSPDNRTELLSHLKRWLSQSNYKSLTLLLKKAGLSLEKEEGDSDWQPSSMQGAEFDVIQDEQSSSEEDDDRLYFPGTFGKMSAMKKLEQQMLLAKDQLDIENVRLAKQHFVEGLENVQTGAWNIWTSNAGKEVVAAFEMLSSLSNTEEFVQSLHGLILNEVYAADWTMVNKLITSIGKKLDSSEASRVFHAVLEHIRFMLRTPDDVITKYEWFEQETQDTSNNILLTDLFIWLFNHPKNIIKHRAPQILKGMTRIDSSFFVPMLINKSVSLETSVSPEICAGILHSLAIEDASLVWEYIQIGENQKRIAELDHFMIKHSFLEIANLARKEYGDAAGFYTLLSETFATDQTKRELDSHSHQGVDMPYWLREFNSLLTPLEQLGLLVSTDYEELVNCIRQLCLPLSVEELIRADSYVARSYRSSNQKSELLERVRKGINQLLSKRVSHEKLTQAASFLRIYNPYFPIEGIRLTSKPSLLSLIEELVSGSGDAEHCTQDGAYDYLHYLETIFCPLEGPKAVEIIGFLAGPNAFQIPFKIGDLYDTFFSNEQPNFQDVTSSPSQMYRPAIFKVEPIEEVSGGIMTPAFIHPQLDDLLGELRELDVIRESWLEGRDWDVDRIGMPLREGCRLLISKENTRRLSLTPWRLVWLVRYDFTTSFIIDRDQRTIIRFG